MKSAALQQAIYTRLNNTALTDLLSSAYSGVAIFSDVPQADDSEDAADFPYVVIAGDTITAWDTKDAAGGTALVQVDIYVRSTSKLAAKAIADAVDLRLRRQPLAITGTTHITTELESMTPTTDPDGKTYRLLLLYRVIWLDV